MKKFVFIFFLAFASCTTYKQIANEKIELNSGSSEINYYQKSPMLKVSVDGKDQKFLFDTGAMTTYITDSTSIDNFSQKKFGYMPTSVSTADNKKVKRKYFVTTLKSNLFRSENKSMSFVPMPPVKCENKSDFYSGILGMDCFFSEKFSTNLNFSRDKISNISLVDQQDLIKNDHYREIKSSFGINKFYIFCEIEGKEYKCAFDTGYSGSFLLKSDFEHTDKIELEGAFYRSLSGLVKGKQVFYQRMPVDFGGQLLKTRVNTTAQLYENLVGIDFIKGFDWLIDYKNKKMYVHRNNNKIADNVGRAIYYFATIDQERLFISVKESSQKKHNLGDEITAVNGKKVTPQNNCDLQDLLNRTEDWSSLNLEIVPATP